MRKQSSVLIGCGAIGREHLIAITQLPNVEVTAVCDLSAARAEATAERFGIAHHYTSVVKLLAEHRPDLVHITSTPSSHFEIARSCLAAGLNVLCEKPITVTYSEFAILKKMAIEKKCMLMENQQLRFHSSIQYIQHLLSSRKLGDLLRLQICISVNIVAPGSPFIDENAPHFGLTLRGGVVGDFLPHIAYLAYMFVAPIIDLRTIWNKHKKDTPLPTDEFCALIKGERATAYVSFSGNAQPDGFWIRVAGTRMHVEANMFEPPRLTVRRPRSGEHALGTLVDGITESRDVLRTSIASFWRKLGGKSSYDGLIEFFARIYRALELGEPQPVPLDEFDDIACLVERFSNSDFNL
jgi:predicted dehydrogenase